VRARVTELQGRAAEKVEASIERWTEEVLRIAHSDIREVLEFGPNYVRLKDGATLTPEQAALIAEVGMTKEGQKIKLHSKLDALEKLAKRFGWYAPEQHQHMVQITKIETVIVDPANRDA
jgi:phage terminase small subunit